METIDQRLVERTIGVKDRISGRFLGRNGVRGVGVGLEEKNGRRTGRIAIRFYVEKKGAVPSTAALPPEIEGVPTDVVEIDLEPPVDLARRPMPAAVDPGRYQTLTGGISIGPKRFPDGSGTLGILVSDTVIRKPMILSNSHVLALSDGKAAKGDDICQQSCADNPLGWCGNCAELDRWMVDNVRLNGKLVGVDAAVARVSTAFRGTAMRTVLEIGAILPTTAPAVLNAQIRKRGRTTGLTVGTVGSVATDVLNSSGLELKNQIGIDSGARPFSASGDSGSVYVSATNQLVGLHWGHGRNSNRGFGSPIDAVLQAMAVHF